MESPYLFLCSLCPPWRTLWHRSRREPDPGCACRRFATTAARMHSRRGVLHKMLRSGWTVLQGDTWTRTKKYAVSEPQCRRGLIRDSDWRIESSIFINCQRHILRTAIPMNKSTRSSLTAGILRKQPREQALHRVRACLLFPDGPVLPSSQKRLRRASRQ
jgi:hypothetical protein